MWKANKVQKYNPWMQTLHYYFANSQASSGVLIKRSLAQENFVALQTEISQHIKWGSSSFSVFLADVWPIKSQFDYCYLILQSCTYLVLQALLAPKTKKLARGEGWLLLCNYAVGERTSMAL